MASLQLPQKRLSYRECTKPKKLNHKLMLRYSDIHHILYVFLLMKLDDNGLLHKAEDIWRFKLFNATSWEPENLQYSRANNYFVH